MAAIDLDPEWPVEPRHQSGRTQRERGRRGERGQQPVGPERQRRQSEIRRAAVRFHGLAASIGTTVSSSAPTAMTVRITVIFVRNSRALMLLLQSLHPRGLQLDRR